MLVGFLKTESATILWDVDRIRRDLKMGALSLAPRLVTLSELGVQTSMNCDESAPCNMNELPVAVSFPKEKIRLLCGDAQLYRARRLSMKYIYCYVLPPELHKKYIIAYDEESYLRAVNEYWEGEWYDPYRDAEAFSETDENE